MRTEFLKAANAITCYSCHAEDTKEWLIFTTNFDTKCPKNTGVHIGQGISLENWSFCE